MINCDIKSIFFTLCTNLLKNKELLLNIELRIRNMISIDFCYYHKDFLNFMETRYLFRKNVEKKS